MGGEPAYALGKAQAQFGRNRPADALATLDDLQKRSGPIFELAEGHLLYARSLAEVGRIDEALEEYHALAAYFPGAEARVRYGMLLRMVGRNAEAQSSVQRTAAADETRAQISARGAGRMAFDR